MAYIDPINVCPNNYRVLLENDQVRVLEMNLKAVSEGWECSTSFRDRLFHQGQQAQDPRS